VFDVTLVWNILNVKPGLHQEPLLGSTQAPGQSLQLINVTSPAYKKLIRIILSIHIPSYVSSHPAFLITPSAHRLNCTGDKMHPCRTISQSRKELCLRLQSFRLLPDRCTFYEVAQWDVEEIPFLSVYSVKRCGRQRWTPYYNLWSILIASKVGLGCIHSLFRDPFLISDWIYCSLLISKSCLHVRYLYLHLPLHPALDYP